MVKVSVVVPTYNRRELLKECLDSLLNQTYPKDEYEVIVVDDGSTDGTEELLREYAKNAPCMFKYFKQENRGPAAARNTGIKHASGEIVCFIDDDCIADKRWIENLISGFTDENIGGVGGEIAAREPRTIVEKMIKFDQRMCAKEYILAGNAAYKKSVLHSLGGFDEELKSLEDIDLGVRVKLKGLELKYVPHAVVFHKHYDNLRWLAKRHYSLGKEFAKLSQKYVYHFSAKRYLVRWMASLMLSITKILTSAPACFLRQGREIFLREFLHAVISLSDTIGLIIGLVTERYSGKRVYDRLNLDI